jgi:hypothetical protein
MWGAIPVNPSPTPAARSLFTQFPHDRGPADPHRTIATGELREWSEPWCADLRFLPSFGSGEWQAAVRINPERLRYFSVIDPGHPHVPLICVGATKRPISVTGAPFDPRLPLDTGIRDKVWQRLVVERIGLLSQPGFAAVNGNRIVACNAPWSVHIETADCRSQRAAMLTAVASGAILLVESVDVGIAAVAFGGTVRVASRNSHLMRLLGGAAERTLSVQQWTEFVRAMGADHLPLGITKAAFNPEADLGDALLRYPGRYIIKPRFGSNGFGVVRVVSHPPGLLTAESDCPDTAQYLEDYPSAPGLRGQDLIAAVATQRARFVDRARAGVPERFLSQSILEDEIRQDRAEGSIFEPRIVVQRMKDGSAEGFATLGALCKRIDTAVGASVARDFREEPLEVSLRRFLTGRVRPGGLTERVRQTRAEILETGHRLQMALVPIIEAHGARVHQFGIDCRLCWNPATERTEYPFLEIQFGIGRIDPAILADGGLEGYRTAAELRSAFGLEVG